MSSVIRRPRQRGFEISISTWTRKNSPPTNSLGFSHGDTYLSVSPNSIAISESSKRIGNPCICTQNFNLVNLKYLDGVDPSNLCNRTACLSKVHGSLARTRSASNSSSNTKQEYMVARFTHLKVLFGSPQRFKRVAYYFHIKGSLGKELGSQNILLVL